MIVIKIIIEEREGGVAVTGFGGTNESAPATPEEVRLANSVTYAVNKTMELYTQITGSTDVVPQVNPNN